MSLWSEDSFLSIASKGSALSIGSVGSFLSVGSIGSFASIAFDRLGRERAVASVVEVAALRDVRWRDGGVMRGPTDGASGRSSGPSTGTEGSYSSADSRHSRLQYAATIVGSADASGNAVSMCAR